MRRRRRHDLADANRVIDDECRVVGVVNIILDRTARHIDVAFIDHRLAGADDGSGAYD